MDTATALVALFVFMVVLTAATVVFGLWLVWYLLRRRNR